MGSIPEELADTADFFDLLPDRNERIDALISIAERFRDVPAEIAARPYPESHRVRECESQAYVWAQARDDGTLQFHIAVENPQGFTAKAMAVIMAETLSGASLDQIAEVPLDIADRIFGGELSIRKSLGLSALVERIKQLACNKQESVG